LRAGAARSRVVGMPAKSSGPKGRGAVANPANRFEGIVLERDEAWDPAQDPAPATRFFRDDSRSIIVYNDSPDVGFDASLNPYRGCEHGCCYCFARPTHEYLGFSTGLDFESKIMVKADAPELLRRALAAKSWRPQTLALSGVTDGYQPVERRLRLTRRCLEVLAECRNPVVVTTKNFLVTRDVDCLRELARYRAVAVQVSLNSLDADLARVLEPRASSPERRLEAVAQLAAAGVPVGVLVAPIIPGLNDHEILRVIAAAAQAGAQWAGKEVLRLPLAVRPLFIDWLERHFPARKEKVLHGIQSLRGGRLNDARFGSRMRGEGPLAEQYSRMFHVACRKAGLADDFPALSVAAFRRPGSHQLELAL